VAGSHASLLAGVAHGVIETRVDDITLTSTLNDNSLLSIGDRVSRVALNQVQQSELALLLPFFVLYTRTQTQTDAQMTKQVREIRINNYKYYMMD
jgi:hypothetical protein